MTNAVSNKSLFESLYTNTSSWLFEICSNPSTEEKTWSIANGTLRAVCYRTRNIPKAGLSLIIHEDQKEVLYRIGLNIYPQQSEVPDGSFAIMLSKQDDSGFIGGVIELFPAIIIAEDIEIFKNKLRTVARTHGQDYEACRKGLIGAFPVKDSNETLGAEAGFNFYQAGLEATPENILFAREAFLMALDGFKIILEKEHPELSPKEHGIKERCWHKHLTYMQEDDVGIKMSLEQGMPMDFFSFSVFPP
jgi:hypothetical protein